MRDEDRGGVGYRWAAAVAVVTVLPMAGPAHAQRLHGQAAVEYQNLDRASAPSALETWIKTFQTDYARSLPGAIEFTSRLRFAEQTIVGRPDRIRNPEGSLRFAHRSFGLSAAYQPTESRDSRSVSTRQQTFSLIGYAQRQGLPRVAGSWIRTHLDASSQSPASATVARNLSAVHTLPNVGFRAAYGDRLVRLPGGLGDRVSESHYSLGSSSSFRIARAPVSLQYDFSHSRANPTGLRSLLSRMHTASGSSSLQLAARASTSLAYIFRRTESIGPGGSSADEHNGAFTVSYSPAQALQTSANAGVRSATLNGRTETERFVSATASAQGVAREGWRVAASANHSLNWLPGETVRVADSFQASTSLRLAQGLETRGDLGISSGRRPTAPTDTARAPTDLGLQAGAAITANPLRRVAVDASVHYSHVGRSLLSGGSSSTSHAGRLRLTPTARLQLSGGWSRTRSLGSQGTSLQTAAQWSVSSSLQASGSYTRSKQELSAMSPPLSTLQESRSGTLVMALGRQLNGSLRYSESNWRGSTHVRQVSASMVRSFGG